MATKVEQISFPGAQGHVLAARLHMPDEASKGCAIFAHCFTCSKDTVAASRVSAALARRGIGVLRFDFTGLGASEGEFADTNFSSNVEDLLCAASFLKEHHQAPKILIGHSLGGAAVLAAAGKIEGVVAVATIAAPSDPHHISHLFAHALDGIEAGDEAEVNIAGRPFRVKRQMLDDLASQNLKRDIGALGKALLIFHSPEDEIVGIEHARYIYDAARHPKSFVSLDHADHLLTRKADADYVAEILAAWSSRYLKVDDSQLQI